MPASRSVSTALPTIGRRLVCVVVRLRHLGAEDHLLRAGDNLRLVSLHRLSARPLHRRVSSESVVLILRSVSAAGSAGVGLRSASLRPCSRSQAARPARFGLVDSLLLGLLLLQLLLAAAQPLPARAPVRELGRQLVTACVAEYLILGGVRFRGLAEHPLDLRAVDA
jgi:hypothetical protein